MSCELCGQKSMNCDCTQRERDQADHIEHLESQLEQLQAALEKSVKLQSHYAELLNVYDGGRRLQFADAQAWLERLSLLDSKQTGD
jgi:hypothetical protein